MNILIIGLGNQGNKRINFLENNYYEIIDPVNKKANYKDFTEFKKKTKINFDACIISCPDNLKYNYIIKCLDMNMHILVEKPLWFRSLNQFNKINKILKRKKLICYTAYNHRFEPLIKKLKNYLDKELIGKIYYCKFNYGNGTAKLVKHSNWKDKDSGVIKDLGSHQLDLLQFIFSKRFNKFIMTSFVIS